MLIDFCDIFEFFGIYIVSAAGVSRLDGQKNCILTQNIYDLELKKCLVDEKKLA